MGQLFGKTPDLPPPPPPPAIDPTVQAQTSEADRQARLAAAQGGRASTQLTGGLGDTSAPMTASRKLLGS